MWICICIEGESKIMGQTLIERRGHHMDSDLHRNETFSWCSSDNTKQMNDRTRLKGQNMLIINSTAKSNKKGY